jgi:hypothetical protein
MTLPNRRPTRPDWELIICLLVGGATVVGALWITKSAGETERVIQALILLLAAAGVLRAESSGRGPDGPGD